MLSKYLTISIALFSFACAEAPKPEVPTSTVESVNRLNTEMTTALLHHLDVLAVDEFTIAQKSQAAAQKALSAGDTNEKILEQTTLCRTHLSKGHKLAKARRPALEGIIKTREMAINAGVRNYPKFESDLAKSDDRLRDMVEDLKNLNPQDFSALQSRYMDLELATVKSNNLDKFIAVIDDARDEKRAKKVTPKTLLKAELDLRNAENMIAAQRGKPENYKSAVDQAGYSTTLLADVLAAAKKDDTYLDEDTAVNIVMQNRRISSLQGELGDANNQKVKLGQKIEEQGKKIDAQGKRIAVAGVAIRLQKTMEAARKAFSKQEAEVYQQGNKLLIRLKAMNFKSGGSDLPASSLTLLAKVKKVITDLGAQEIVIEGHTDSAGEAAANDSLSQARAEAVAHYLETSGIDSDKVKAVGFGFKKPLATNKTNIGRAQNRRVDVIISPAQGEQRMAETVSEDSP